MSEDNRLRAAADRVYGGAFTDQSQPRRCFVATDAIEELGDVLYYGTDAGARDALPTDEMCRLARHAWDDGTYGEPATTLASYVLALLGEPPFPVQDADSDERRTS